MANIFISYTRESQALVTTLTNDLAELSRWAEYFARSMLSES